MLTRKERWGLSARGWATIAFSIAALCYICFRYVHPFLAITEREDARVLVVEGWVHDFASTAAVQEFKAGAYTEVFATGGPVAGNYTSDYDTLAHVGARRLESAGIAPERVHMVAAHVTGRDRTYSSAIALREWFLEHHSLVRNINVVTEGAHARRTRLLFHEAFGKECRIGIIAIPNPNYEAAHWWRYSEGVREVLGETVAYLYAKFFFYPPPLKPKAITMP